MIASQVLIDAFVNFCASDTNSPLSANSDLQWGLVKAPFTPDPALALADLDVADFTGSAAKSGGSGACLVVNSPLTSSQGLLGREPAGGLNFVATALTNLPQTIYGYYVYNNNVEELMFTALLPEPIEIQVIGDFVSLTSLLAWFNLLFFSDEGN